MIRHLNRKKIDKFSEDPLTFPENEKTKGFITKEEFSMPQSILQVVSEKGFDGMRDLSTSLINGPVYVYLCNSSLFFTYRQGNPDNPLLPAGSRE